MTQLVLNDIRLDFEVGKFVAQTLVLNPQVFALLVSILDLLL